MKARETLTLDNAKLGVSYIICDVQSSSNQLNRMFDLGIIKNSSILPLFKSMFGDTVAYLIKGSVIAIRKKDAQKIKVFL